MTKRKSFIRTGRVLGHDVLFIGNFALPLHFTLAVTMIVAIAYLITWLGTSVNRDPIAPFLGYGLLVVAAVPILVWAGRGLSWVVRVTRKINGGRVDS